MVNGDSEAHSAAGSERRLSGMITFGSIKDACKRTL